MPTFKKPFSKFLPWLIWATAALFPTYQFMLQSSPSPMLTELTKDLSISYVQASFITTYFFFSYIVMQVPAGILVDIVGPRILLVLGSLFAGISCVIFSSCECLWIAESARLIMGFSCATALVSVFSLIDRWFEPKRFALLLGLTETFAMAGSALALVSLTFSVQHFGWRQAVLLCGILGIGLSMLIFIIVRNHPNDSSIIEHRASSFSLKKELSNLFEIIKRSQVWINGLYTGLTFAVIPAFFALWGIPFFSHRYHISPTQSASIVSLGLLGAGIGSPFLGWLSDHIKKRKPIMILGSLISTLCLYFIIHVDAPLYLAGFLNLLLGFTCSSYVLSFAIIKEILPPNVKGKAMGFANMLCLLIGAPILQPAIAHIVKDNIGTGNMFKFALLPLTLSLALSLILTFWVRETHCKDVYLK